MPRKTLQQFEERFQDLLERIKVTEYTRLNRVYSDIAKLVTSAILELDGEISAMRRTQLNRFIAGVATKQRAMIEKMLKSHKEELVSFAGYSYQMEASLIATTVGVRLASAAKARAIYMSAIERPLATGDLLDSFIDNLTRSQVGVLEKTLRKAHVNGWTNAQITRMLRGTKKLNYADGLMSKMGKQTATVVRTSMQHINSSARQVIWAENSDIITGYRWVSTLDGRTSDICQDLDGEVFKVGDGPVPPAHPNCRSTTVAELDSRFDVLSEGATRASAYGYMPLNTTYKQWKEDNGITTKPGG